MSEKSLPDSIFEEICTFVNEKLFKRGEVDAQTLFQVNHALAENALATCLAMVAEEDQPEVIERMKEAAHDINKKLREQVDAAEERLQSEDNKE